MQKFLDSLPKRNNRNLALHVTKAAEKHIRAGHPWLFENSIQHQNHDDGAAGDLAIVFDRKDRFCAIGLYDPDSPIRVKILHQGESVKINRDFFAEKIAKAATIREPLLETDTDGYRLIHGENDGLPSIIVDRYANTLVVKIYSAMWLPHLRDFLPALFDVQPAENVVLRLSRHLQESQDFIQDGQVIMGQVDEPIVFHENGLRFAADVIKGHKTGFFFDQRDNRALVRKFAEERRVLDIFAYSGGFSVNAAAGGAESVLSVDVSQHALDSALENMALNDLKTPHDTITKDAFALLEDFASEGEEFDLVIVDPPTFTSSGDQIGAALTSYARLTELALDVLAFGGLLVMASCSSRISMPQFEDVIITAANDVDMPLLIQHHTQHAIDHPILEGFPEGAYLKCIYATAIT